MLAAVEVDELAATTYEANHPGVMVKRADIRKLPADGLMRELGMEPGDLDLLAGCPPCQGYSRLRTRNGRRLRRHPGNELLDEFVRFVRVLKPKAVLMENVPGLRGHRRFQRLLSTLRQLGYAVEYRILNAADYGVPQSRRRLVLVAGRGGSISFATPAAARATVSEAIRWLPLPGGSGDDLHDVVESRSAKVRALIERIPRDGGSRAALGSSAQLACHRKVEGFSDIYGRMAWGRPAPTITGGCVNPSKGRFLHPEQDRAITLREAALLQSFPPDYQFSLDRGKFAAALMIGNALPPEFGRRQAVGVRRHLMTTQRRDT